MRAGSANGGVDRAGGGADAANAPKGAVGRDKQAQSNPSSSGSAASSSSGRGEAAEEGGGGKDDSKQGRRRSKRRDDVVRAIRDRLPAAPACWGNNVSVVRERRRVRRERPGDGGAVEAEGEEEGDGSGAGALPAWCCLCHEGGDCSLEPNPSANGKEDPGLRSLLERNDFYSDDCNPHAAAAAAANDGEEAATPDADFD